MIGGGGGGGAHSLYLVEPPLWTEYCGSLRATGGEERGGGLRDLLPSVAMADLRVLPMRPAWNHALAAAAPSQPTWS